LSSAPGADAAAAESRARGDRALAALLFVALFGAYALGACRTIYVGDSGELVTAVHLLGIPHPSGYPLYVLAGKVWTLAMPFGSIAFRMSLFSAACAAAACALSFAAGRSIGLGRIASLTGALLLAFASSFWAEANVQRVYALGALFVAAAAWAALRWHRERTRGSLALVTFVCGLGATNHTYMAVFAFAFGLFAVAVDPAILRRTRDLGAAAVTFALGLLPYALLPLRSRSDPALDWGDPETLDRLVAVITRRGFWERRWLESPRDWLAITGDWLASFPEELGWGGAALLLLGFASAFRRPRPAAAAAPLALLAALGMFGNLLVLGLHGSRSDLFLWHRYYIPSYLLAALVAACGVEALAERLPRRLLPLILALPLAQLATGWRAHDRSDYRIAEGYSRRLLASLPPGADLVASDDNILFVLLYLRHVEGLRPDVNLIAQGVGDADLPFLRFDPSESRLYFTHHPNWNHPELDLVPEGLAFHVVRRGMAPRPVALEPRELAGESDPRVPKDYLTRNLIGEFHFMLGINLERRTWEGARREFEKAAEAAPDNDVLHYNLGLVYERRGELAAALASFERSHAINPRHLASKSQVRAADRIAALRRRVAAAP
jgi:tetratricopeptide (TPR) repeat protein